MPLWIDLQFATIIVYSLDSLFNDFCKDLLDILKIMNHISITVFVCFTCNMLFPVPKSVYLFKQKVFTIKVVALCAFYLSSVFEKQAGGIVLGSVTVSGDVLLYISVAIKTSFLKFDMCNICKNDTAKMFLVFF